MNQLVGEVRIHLRSQGNSYLGDRLGEHLARAPWCAIWASSGLKLESFTTLRIGVLLSVRMVTGGSEWWVT